MIIHIHSKEIPSKTGAALAADLAEKSGEVVCTPESKTAVQWREFIDAGEVITIVAPIYWWGLSYEFDKWFQDVFSMGWAFDYSKQPTGLLQGKKMVVHLTQGTPAAYAEAMQKNITERLEKGVFGYCGIETEIHFHEVMHDTEEV